MLKISPIRFTEDKVWGVGFVERRSERGKNVFSFAIPPLQRRCNISKKVGIGRLCALGAVCRLESGQCAVNFRFVTGLIV